MEPHDFIQETEQLISIMRWNGMTLDRKRFFSSTVDKLTQTCTVQVLNNERKVIRKICFNILPLPNEDGRYRFMADTENCRINALDAYTFKLDLLKIGLVPTGIFAKVRLFDPDKAENEDISIEE